MSESETLPLGRSDIHQGILQAWQSSMTGVQEFRGEGSERSLFWHEGKLVFATSRDEADRLQEILMARGHFTREQFNELAPHFQAGQSIGRNLVDSGLITQKDLVQGARSQVQQIFNGCFAYASATMTLRSGEEHLPTLRIPLELPTAIVPAVLALEDRTWLAQEAQGFFHRRLMLLPRAEGAVLDQLSFAVAVLPLLDGSRDFAQIGFECDVEEFRLLKLLYLLQLLGWLEVGEPEPDQATVRQELADVLVEPPPAPQRPPHPLAETATLPKVMSAQTDPTIHLPRLPETRPASPHAPHGGPGTSASLLEAEPAMDEDLPEPPLAHASREEPSLLALTDQRPLFARPWFLVLLLIVLAAPVLWLAYRTPEPPGEMGSDNNPLENSYALFPQEDSSPSEEAASAEPQTQAQANPDPAEPNQSPDASPAAEADLEPSQTFPAEESRELRESPPAGEQPFEQPQHSPVAETLPPYVRQPQATTKERPVRSMDLPSAQPGEGAARPTAAKPNPPAGEPVDSGQISLDQPAGSQPAGSQPAGRQPADPQAAQDPPDPSSAVPLTSKAGSTRDAEPEDASHSQQSAEESTAANPLPPVDAAAQDKPAEPSFASAQEAWQAGSFAAAAQLWLAEMAGRPATSWVVALELACQESSLRLASQLVPKPELLFLLPRNLQGKPCYWVCYGFFEQEEQAKQALAELDFFRKSNANPPMVRRLAELMP
jgi:hypothetical protein